MDDFQINNGVQIIIIVLLALGVSFLLYFIIKSIATPKKIDAIQKLLKDGKTSAAIKAAKAILVKDPNDYLAHYYLGQAYLKDNKSELALMEFSFVNKNAIFDNRLPEITFRKELSQLYLKFNQPDDALKEFLLLTKMEPKNSDNYYYAGQIYEQKNHPEVALGFYQKAVAFNKRNVKAHAALGLILFRSKQFDKAKKEIDLAISLSPETYSTYYYQGKIFKENKEYGSAVQAFEKAERDPEFKQRALIERGTCFMLGNSIDNAMADFQRAISASKNDRAQETMFARYFLASCYEKNRSFDKAIEQWTIIYNINHSFRDVATKLSEYRDLQTNDSMKEYLTSSAEEFVEICKKAALSGFSLSAQQSSSTKWGCEIIACEQKDDDWMNMRKQLALLWFYRDTDPVDDTAVRKMLDTIKEKNFTKGIIFTSTGFTRSAAGFAENRPVELVGKEKLEAVLSKSGV